MPDATPTAHTRQALTEAAQGLPFHDVSDFEDAERECAAILKHGLALPAYDQCIKASHLFNLLDARGVISVTERAAYIARVRTLAKGCCEAWVAGETA